MDWVCICGNFVSGKRFCPRCKHMRFRIDRSEFLDYFGFNLGSLSNGLPFNLPINYLTSHVLVAGQTGTGKTRLAMKLAVEAENYVSLQKVGLLIVDVEGEWKNIIPLLKGKTEYYDVGSNLRINPFDLQDPALVRELLRETVFKGIEKEYSDLSAQMNFVLQETIARSSNMAELVQNIRNYEGQLNNVEKTKTALMVRLDPFLRSPLKEIFFCRKSNPDFARLGECNTIMDLHALDSLVAYNDELRLIYNTITTYFLRKMLGREPTDYLTNLFICDEAQLLVPRILQKIIITESWPATEFATRLRKRGCGLLLMTQSPSNLEQDIVKNMATKIIFRLQWEEDIRLIAASTGFADIIEYEYLSDNLVRLPVKSAIVCTDSREPFLVTAANFELPKFIPSVIPPAEPSLPLEGSEKTVTGELPSQTVMNEAQTDSKLPADLGDDERVFMQSIKNEPFIGMAERRSTLGWDDAKYSQIVDELVRREIVEKVRVTMGRGGQRVLYQIKGQVPGIKHEFYVNWIADQLGKMGVVCQKSKVGPDIQIPTIRTAVNVELGKSSIRSNIAKALDNFSAVIVCSDDEEMLDKLSTNDQRVITALVWDVPRLFERIMIN